MGSHRYPPRAPAAGLRPLTNGRALGCAEDVVQETWVVAWRYVTAPARAGRDFPEGALSSWLRRAAAYLILQELKRQRLAASSSLDELLEARRFEPVAPNPYDAGRSQREAMQRAQRRQHEAAGVLERNLALLLASAPSPERHEQVESLRRELAQVRKRGA